MTVICIIVNKVKYKNYLLMILLKAIRVLACEIPFTPLITTTSLLPISI
jgi:hypothetical protein